MSRPKAQPEFENAVSRATSKALERVDAFLQEGTTIDLPESKYLDACDHLLTSVAPSIFTALFFFMFYRLEVPDWDLNSLPTSWRGKVFGDKFLCNQLRNYLRTQSHGGS